MYSKLHSHDHLFGTRWTPATVALTLLLTLLFLIFLVLFLNLTAVPALAQNSVPPTARQAATMPQYAAHLAHAAQPRSRDNASHTYLAQPKASYKDPLDQGAHARRTWPLDNGTVYENGPINGTTDAWTINSGFVVSDTLTVASGGGPIEGLTFGAWAFPGDVLQTVEISITSSEFGGTTYFDQVVNFTQSGCSGNQYGFNICTETSANFGPVNIAAGNYWVNLANAVVNTGDPIYWDENSGIECESQGCPSEASQTSTGTIPSEAFTILGGTTTTCPQGTCGPGCAHDEGNFNIIYNFSQNQPAQAGLAIDLSGRLYGLIQSGAGSAYQLALHGGSWILNSLYTFLGGGNGQNPSGEIVGPDYAVYGIADGGFQNCGTSGNQYCGLIYRLRPSPVACVTALCSWSEDEIYQFAGDPDGWSPDGNLVFDQEGRLYGTTSSGGAYGLGTVYELTPSTGGWSERVIYSFTGGSDGSYPGQLLFGHDGYLYGTSTTGFFRLIGSGGNWGLKVLTNRPDGCYGFVQDGSGNFYCFDTVVQDQNNQWGEIWELSYSDWRWSLIETRYSGYYCSLAPCYDDYHSLAVNPAGQVYATEGALYHRYINLECGYVFYCDGNIHQVDGPFLVDFNGDVFRDLEIGANGNFYGTNGACGGSYGTAWQLSP
jgi:uncharacterized repeat protein (TIGR03803 family)